ncbi:hypothetical protein [Halorarius litoreus]|uniref:hypothetical protein n=1 Tax=Halorarius litoreus TaxID=2962676 RepID=UPI0020CF1800|nr:hypothetical protein [Halorarius litoreus]
MRAVLDASVLIALGQIGELELLRILEQPVVEDAIGSLYIPPAVAAEVTTEPAATNLDRFVENTQFETSPVVCPAGDTYLLNARSILGEEETNGDVQIIAIVELWTDSEIDVAVVSDDRRVRTVAQSLGATVTGTIGVIVRAVEELGISEENGKDLVRRVDSHGLHMTGELREKAYELVEDAATDSDEGR